MRFNGPRVLLAGTGAAIALLLAAAVPAHAATPATPGLTSGTMTRVSAAAADQLQARGTQRAPDATGVGAHPDGFGFTPGNCGLALLWTDSPSRGFTLQLQSFDGDVTGGWYVIYTDGLLSATQAGGIPGNEGTEPEVKGTILDPGALPNTATAYGVANTIEGPCVFYVVADWSPL